MEHKGYVQNSYTEEHQGVLYLVATPIGNLSDMTERAVEVLRDVDIIAAEDTRQTRKLLQVYNISTRLISYHEHNKQQKGETLLHDLQQGKRIALVSDAGLPGVSDPGADIAQLAVQAHIPVIPIPGVSASLTSLIASGLSTERFLFYGFLSRQKNRRKKELESIKNLPFTIIVYEAPHRVIDALEDMHEVLGDRQISVGRELTKKFEQFIRGSINFCRDVLLNQKIQGEFTIIIEGVSEAEQEAYESNRQWWSGMTPFEHVEAYIAQGESSKDAIKRTAKDRDVQKREIYQAYHGLDS